MGESPTRTGVIKSTRDYEWSLSSPESPDCTVPSSPISWLPGEDVANLVSNSFKDTPREIRNKAEKQRRDKLNQSIAELASLVPPVVAASRKIDKTGVLRLTAHYLRSHQYVFGDAINRPREFTKNTAETLLGLLNGFLLTTTYKGIVVVVSPNVQQFLGYSELDLLGQNIFNITHEDDRQLLREHLMPRSHLLGPNGELLVPEDLEAKRRVEQSLANERKTFLIRFKKLSQRSEPNRYVTCHVEGSLRKSDRASRGYSRVCQIVRRARARGDNPCSSGNDVVFIGIVRPTKETFISEKEMESFKMEYRTRHSVDGQIIQCEQRIALVTGYMTNEVNGVNAMNFMHRDDVRWVIIALREMYDEHRLFGESCYRLMMKNGQFIYMKTRGCLEVDLQTRAVTSFVCTNTVVGEEEGKHLNKLMKKKFALMVNNDKEPPPEDEYKDLSDQLPVEDPKNLEKVILHLVTNLPCPQPEESNRDYSPDRSESPFLHLSIIPPQKERILSAIDKIYSIIKHDKMERKSEHVENGRRTPSPSTFNSELSAPTAPNTRRNSPISSPVHRSGFGHINPASDSSQMMEEIAMVRRQMEGSIFGIASSSIVPVPDEPAATETNSSDSEEENTPSRYFETISEGDINMDDAAQRANSTIKNYLESITNRPDAARTADRADLTGIISAASVASIISVASVAGLTDMSGKNGISNITGPTGRIGFSGRPSMAVSSTSVASSSIESILVENTSSTDLTETGTGAVASTSGSKRPKPTSDEEAKTKISKSEENVSTTFNEFLNESLTEDNLSNLTRNSSLGTFPELMESQDIDVEDLLQDIEKAE